jgi:hypothetical protein
MENAIYTERTTCRICDGLLETVLDLGNIAVNDFVDDVSEAVYSPLTLVKCSKCQLVQLKHTTDQDRLYSQYWYQSGLNKGMVASLKDVVDGVEKRVDLKDGDTVIDIGCNDGTMLGLYSNKKLNRIGFDPAKNLAERASKNCEIFHNTYFGVPGIETPLAKVITSIAMFYDLEDPHAFIKLIKKSLAIDGIWVIQFTDLLSMFRANAFDNICHEHLEYYSFAVLKKLIEDHDLRVFDVETNDVNGGSVRAYVCRSGMQVRRASVSKYLATENAYMNQWPNPFKAFAERVEGIKNTIVDIIAKINSKGGIIACMGASTKGNTLLQYFGLSEKQIKFAAEVNPDKFGKKTVATNIPIISEDEAMKRKPDYFLLLPWHFKDGILKKHEVYTKTGGKFIIPCPKVEII